MHGDPNAGGTEAHHDEQTPTSHLAVISWPQSVCWLYWWLPPHLHCMGSPTLLQGPDGAMGSPTLAFSPFNAEKIKYHPVKP